MGLCSISWHAISFPTGHIIILGGMGFANPGYPSEPLQTKQLGWLIRINFSPPFCSLLSWVLLIYRYVCACARVEESVYFLQPLLLWLSVKWPLRYRSAKAINQNKLFVDVLEWWGPASFGCLSFLQVKYFKQLWKKDSRLEVVLGFILIHLFFPPISGILASAGISAFLLAPDWFITKMILARCEMSVWRCYLVIKKDHQILLCWTWQKHFRIILFFLT